MFCMCVCCSVLVYDVDYVSVVCCVCVFVPGDSDELLHLPQ